MAYETKALLVAIAEVITKSENPREIYGAVARMANAEGVVLKAYDEIKAEQAADKTGCNEK